jgi:hypothetical protein
VVASRSILPPQAVRFDMTGELTALRKGTVDGQWTPTRPVGGWLATWAKIGPNGGIVPTFDREDQWFEAAKALGQIDFSDYLQKGRLNDTHLWDEATNSGIMVGIPTALEYHDETTPLAKAHRKVGWWTEGHLFDRHDPESWTRHGVEPTAQDLDRSDYYWRLGHLLKGTPRALGISAHGKMLLSPCGKRIIWAKVQHAAVCEIPQNPDSLLYPLRMAVPITRSMIGASPCESCACPPGACRDLRKAMTSGTMAAVVPEDLEQSPANHPTDSDTEIKVERLVSLLCERNPHATRSEVLGWVRSWLKAKTSNKPSQHEAQMEKRP